MKIHKNFLTTIALWCTMLGMIWCLGTPQVFGQADVITDDNLEIAINKVLGRSAPHNQPISNTDLASATFNRLDASDLGITDLTGLNYAINLRHLNLADNRITNISVLSSVRNLTYLNLANNNLEDTVQRQAPTLEYPDGRYVVQGTPVLSPLAGLTSLVELNLANNSIVTIAPVTSLLALRRLRIQNNNISEFSPLQTNTGLANGGEVWLGANRFSQDSTISLDTLRKLGGVDEYELAAKFPGLSNAELKAIQVKIPGFYYDAQLLMNKGITLYATFGKVVIIPDVDLRRALHLSVPLAITEEFLDRHPTDAEYLTVVTTDPLTEGALSQLRWLNLSYESGFFDVQDLRGLEHCTNLEVLLLDGCDIIDPDPQNFGGYGDYEPLAKLTKLKVLGLSNQFNLDPNTGIQFLENLTNLRWLDLQVNFLTDISPLAGLTALERLDLRDNNLGIIPGTTVNDGITYATVLNSLLGLTNLQMLYLHEQRALSYADFQVLRTLADRIQHRWVTDTVIVKSYGFADEPLAYGAESSIRIEVTFHGQIIEPSLVPTFIGNEHSGLGELKKPYLGLFFDDGVPRVAEWLFQTYDKDWNSTKVIFDYPVQPDNSEGEVTLEHLTLEIPSDGAMVHYRPVDNSIFPFYDRDIVLSAEKLQMARDYVQYPNQYGDPRYIGSVRPEFREEGGTLVRELVPEDRWQDEPYVIRSLRFDPFLENLPQRSVSIIRTPQTVQLSRAGGETGTATGDFTMNLVFSGPLDEASASALASKVSLSDVAGVSVGSLTRPGPPTAYEPETWTLSVAVAAGASGDVTVTLDPEGLKDVTDPGNLIVEEGSTLSVTVPVDRPQDVPETVEATDVASVGSSLEFPISFVEDGVTYEGTAKPYITIYVGERVAANERNAVWARAEDVNSTLVTFTYEIGAGDLASSVSLKTEEGISIPEGTTFVSETLRVAGEDPPASGPGETPRKSSTDAAEPVAGNPSLTSVGGATRVSLRGFIAVPTVLEIRQEIVGSVYIPETAEETKTGASSVPRSPLVFNELGNGVGDANDWLEFRNVTGSAVSLKDWELSVVQDGKKEDTSLIVFTDVSVPANGLLLVVNTSPDKSSLAAGDDIAGSGKNGGLTHLYLVNSGLSLPDDGKFLLILRKSKEKLGKDEAFVDVAGGGGSGTDAFVREQSGSYDTHVWPLQVREAPGGDTEEALGSGKVWQRAKADIVGYHKDAWAQAAFTGLGYDRKVSKSAATAGTPGYPNGAVKTEASTPKGSITISEVMFDSGGGKLPQWVELYNKSKTEAINLNRWKLELQNVNSGDLVGRPIVTLTLGEKVIQPNQTLLIVAGPARASSGSLPADRVYDLLALHEKNLRIKKPQDTFLSAIGFYLKLSDANGTKIDEVGNTDGNRRTNEVPAWALPVSLEEGVRSSLIRRYTKGTSTAEDGMERGSWVLAANIRRFVAGSEAFHWGHADDIGTPGYRGGGPLPVELSSFAVKRAEAGAVVVTWTTESEVDNAGFNLRRSEKRDSGWTLLNPALIAGAGTTGERQAYTFTDTSAKPGVEYYYQIEEVAFDGRPVTLVTRFLPGPVSASNRMLTTFGGMKKAK